jgi:integrase/recombinase XerD
VFQTARKAPAGTPTVDVCPVIGHARLFYRQAETMFAQAAAVARDGQAGDELATAL